MAETALVEAPHGRAIACAEWGVPDGWPLFVLHGAPGSRYLRHIGGKYERQQVRVITYDRPGYRRSTRRPGLRVVDAAEDVALIANQLGIDEFAVLGSAKVSPLTQLRIFRPTALPTIPRDVLTCTALEHGQC